MIEVIVFFVISYCSGLFYPAFYAMIGSPSYVKHPSLSDDYQVMILGITKPSMILRQYGQWLCRKQNEFEFEHDKSLISIFNIALKKDDYKNTKAMFSTSYGRSSLLHTIPAMWHKSVGVEVISSLMKNPALWEVVVKTLPGETAAIEYNDGSGSGKWLTAYSTPLYPEFSRADMPISPYKAMGLCSICSVFWMLIISLAPGFIAGYFPLWCLFLVPSAYGVAALASKSYEI